ncbi:unnamed protein product [Urochloa humidicola]
MSRQARKEAATTARDLPKADVVALQRKGPRQGRKPPAPELSSDWAACVSERSLARSFSDDTFFNNSACDFFSSPQSSNPATWGTDEMALL